MKKFLVHISICSLTLLLTTQSQLSWGQRSSSKKTDTALSPAALRESEFNFIEGEKFFILEDYTKALLYFQRAQEFNPENAAIAYKIAEVLAKGNKQEDFLKAATSIEKALKLEKKNKYFYALASSIYSSLSNYPKAEATLETLMAELPGEDEYLYELAALYVFDKKPLEAIKVYDKAERQLGISEISSVQKQQLYMDLGRTDEAIREGEKLMNAFPDEERYVLAFAETLSSHKLANKAIGYVENYLTVNPNSGNAKVLVAMLYKQNGDQTKAKEVTLAAFEDPAIEINGKLMLAEAFYETVVQNRNKNHIDSALEDFTITLASKLVSVNPTNGSVHLLAGDIYMTLKKEKEAQHEYILATKNGSSSFEAWQNLLYIDSQLNQFDSLILHTENALEYFPNNAMIFYFNGYGQFRKNHFQQAVAALEQAKKLSSSNPTFKAEIDGLLGDSYNGLKEFTLSDKAYDEALSIDPNNSGVLNNYSYYLALRKDHLEKAEKMAALLIKNNPMNASYLDTYAWVLFMRGNYREAKKVMEKAIATGQATATHFEHYGDILYQLSDTQAALEQWQKARSLSNNHEALDRKIATKKLY